MPPVKNNSLSASAQAQQEAISEGIESFELPKSLVTKIARSGLSENAKMQKEVVLSIVKGSTVFINYLAATAHDVAISKQHKSVSASDILKALDWMGMGDMAEHLQRELQIYRDIQKADKTKKGGKGKAKETESGSAKSKGKGKEKGKASVSAQQAAPSTSVSRNAAVPAQRARQNDQGSAPDARDERQRDGGSDVESDGQEGEAEAEEEEEDEEMLDAEEEDAEDDVEDGVDEVDGGRLPDLDDGHEDRHGMEEDGDLSS